MAANILPVPTGAANPCVREVPPSTRELWRIRSSMIERIDAAAEKAKWGRNPEFEGMPHRLFVAGCYLAAHGFSDFPSAGERWFNTNFIAYRALASADAVEEGRRAIYEGGRRAIAPVVALQVAA